MTGHDEKTIIEIYEETTRDAGVMITGDGQRIPMVVKVVKIACECGNVSLDEYLFADEPESE